MGGIQQPEVPIVSICPHDPRVLLGEPIGMYHCPECGEMVIAGLPHPVEPEDQYDLYIDPGVGLLPTGERIEDMD